MHGKEDSKASRQKLHLIQTSAAMKPSLPALLAGLLALIAGLQLASAQDTSSAAGKIETADGSIIIDNPVAGLSVTDATTGSPPNLPAQAQAQAPAPSATAMGFTTALATFRLTGANALPFDSWKSALFVKEMQAVLGTYSNATTVSFVSSKAVNTTTGAPAVDVMLQLGVGAGAGSISDLYQFVSGLGVPKANQDLAKSGLNLKASLSLLGNGPKATSPTPAAPTSVLVVDSDVTILGHDAVPFNKTVKDAVVAVVNGILSPVGGYVQLSTANETTVNAAPAVEATMLVFLPGASSDLLQGFAANFPQQFHALMLSKGYNVTLALNTLNVGTATSAVSSSSADGKGSIKLQIHLHISGNAQMTQFGPGAQAALIAAVNQAMSGVLQPTSTVLTSFQASTTATAPTPGVPAPAPSSAARKLLQTAPSPSSNGIDVVVTVTLPDNGNAAQATQLSDALFNSPNFGRNVQQALAAQGFKAQVGVTGVTLPDGTLTSKTTLPDTATILADLANTANARRNTRRSIRKADVTPVLDSEMAKGAASTNLIVSAASHLGSPPGPEVAAPSLENVTVEQAMGRIEAYKPSSMDSLPAEAQHAENAMFMADCLQPGSLFAGRYTIQEGRQRGASSTVVHAQAHDEAETPVVIKFYPLQADFDAECKFYEARRPEGDVGTEFVPRVFDIIPGSATTWSGDLHPSAIVLERGHFSLEEWLSDAGSWEEASDNITYSFFSMCKAIEYLHARNVVHRNLLPTNFMWFGAQCRWKLLDFRCWAPAGTSVPFPYSLRYTAPEVLTGAASTSACIKAEPSADMWSLGVMAFQMFSGRALFPHASYTDAEVTSMLLGYTKLPFESDPALWESIPDADARALVAALLQRDPTQRLPITSVLEAGLLDGMDLSAVA
ncbi:hypothetical protein WJX72_003787 [[Myrmecia] bisecta]|uniref:Protein kinase domain-containing protein n=1 Tax=[Myrmecia] bisecta TaxID=41462 RepID=A0AAW1P3F4_9CHLO